MPGVEERLALLEAEREILRTLHAYSHALDYGDEETFLDCWLEGAALYWPAPPYDEPFVGRERLLEAFRGHTHAPAVFHKHLVVDPRIEIDGDSARVESYYARLDDRSSGPYLFSFGRYFDVLERCSDGRWRFLERRAMLEARIADAYSPQA